VECVECVEQRY
ncbi:hypothetical protein BVRB_018860, partial [Beta vulgaris subsp. vulgaris]